VGMAKARNKQLATGRAHHIQKTTFHTKSHQKVEKSVKKVSQNDKVEKSVKKVSQNDKK